MEVSSCTDTSEVVSAPIDDSLDQPVQQNEATTVAAAPENDQTLTTALLALEPGASSVTQNSTEPQDDQLEVDVTIKDKGPAPPEPTPNPEVEPEEPEEPIPDRMAVGCTGEQSEYSAGSTHTVTALIHIQAPASASDERQSRAPIAVSAVIDRSGSMEGEKLELVKKTMTFVIRSLKRDDQMGIVAYDDTVTEPLPLTFMNPAGTDVAVSRVSKIKTGGSTNLSGGLFAGLRQVQSKPIQATPKPKAKPKPSAKPSAKASPPARTIVKPVVPSCAMAKPKPKPKPAQPKPVAKVGSRPSTATTTPAVPAPNTRLSATMPRPPSSGTTGRSSLPSRTSTGTASAATNAPRTGYSAASATAPGIWRTTDKKLSLPPPTPSILLLGTHKVPKPKPGVGVQRVGYSAAFAPPHVRRPVPPANASTKAPRRTLPKPGAPAKPAAPTTHSPPPPTLQELQQEEQQQQEQEQEQVGQAVVASDQLPMQELSTTFVPSTSSPVADENNVTPSATQNSSPALTPPADAATPSQGTSASSASSSSASSSSSTNATAEPKVEQVDIFSVWLFTDGLANVGIQDGPTLKQEVQARLAKMSRACSVFTFGFGSDHDVNTLTGISEAGNGMYYYIESEDKIPDAFADCLGGLLSVAAQDLHLTLTPLNNGCKIQSIHTAYQHQLTENNVATVDLPDIYCEEGRDILIEVELPTVSEAFTELRPVLMCRLDYKNVLSNQMEHAEGLWCLARPETAVVQQVPVKVDRQKNRVKCMKAMSEARVLAEKSDFEGAKKLLQVAMEEVHTSSSVKDKLSQGLLGNLKDCQENLGDSYIYQSKGCKKMQAYVSAHSKQRSCGTGTVFRASGNPSNL